KLLRRHRAERETGIDEPVRQLGGCAKTALLNRPEANLLRVADALVQVGEGLAVVEIRGMNDVSGSSQLVGECEESAGLALCMVEQQQLGHDALPITPGN